MWRPSSLTLKEMPPASWEENEPSAAGVARTVSPVTRSCRNTSMVEWTSPGTRFEARLLKKTYRPPPLICAPSTWSSAGVPLELTPTDVVSPVARSWT